MSKALIALVALALSGCATMQELTPAPNLADAALDYVREVCAVPAADRKLLLDEFKSAVLPHRVVVQCGPSSK